MKKLLLAVALTFTSYGCTRVDQSVEPVVSESPAHSVIRLYSLEAEDFQYELFDRFKDPDLMIEIFEPTNSVLLRGAPHMHDEIRRFCEQRDQESGGRARDGW